MSKAVITGWIIEFIGTSLWIYGYFVTGHRSFIDWHSSTPWWIADCLPNVEAEIGMVLILAGMVPLYWPARKNN